MGGDGADTGEKVKAAPNPPGAAWCGVAWCGGGASGASCACGGGGGGVSPSPMACDAPADTLKPGARVGGDCIAASSPTNSNTSRALHSGVSHLHRILQPR